MSGKADTGGWRYKAKLEAGEGRCTLKEAAADSLSA